VAKPKQALNMEIKCQHRNGKSYGLASKNTQEFSSLYLISTNRFSSPWWRTYVLQIREIGKRCKRKRRCKPSPKVLSSCSMLQLYLPFASTPPIRNPSSYPTPKRRKTTMNGGEDLRRGGRAS